MYVYMYVHHHHLHHGHHYPNHHCPDGDAVCLKHAQVMPTVWNVRLCSAATQPLQGYQAELWSQHGGLYFCIFKSALAIFDVFASIFEA